MRVINRLKPPGKIRSVRLEPERVTITTDTEVLTYRRVRDEDVSKQNVPVRRRPLSSKV